MTADAMVVPLAARHTSEVLAMSRAGMDEGNARFESTAPTGEQCDPAKIPEYRLTAVGETRQVLGWVAGSKVSDRCAYAGVME
ncbi:hypothetical protein ACFV7Q_08150 [Streptomyces sp. NPDC059851]|uniref:hypothetical protein n=1 Tax=Streptomyces sp. NPDC059851 TaxID=3346971 RepID=UPI00366383CD